MGHINNSVYLTYTEEARIHFLNQLLGLEWDWKNNGIIVRKHEIDYLIPINYPSEIIIKTKISKIGKKSFELTHDFCIQEQVVTKVKTTLVYFNYTKLISKQLDDLILKKLSYV